MNTRIRRSSGAPVILGASDPSPPAGAGEPLLFDGRPTSAAPKANGKALAKSKGKRGGEPASPRSGKPARKPAEPAGGPGSRPAGPRQGKAATKPQAVKPRARGKPSGRPPLDAEEAKGAAQGRGRRGREKRSAPVPVDREQVDLFAATSASEATAPRAATEPETAARTTQRRRATAESMAQKQRDISVSEFFMKNRHLLGFDSPARALLTTVKEAFDNSLDAAEEAGILPTVRVELQEITEERHRVVVQDNGPGIVKAQVPRVFGKLLYGSKFHRLRQSRGQQGIGISAAGMYGQLTTGKPIVITSKTGKGRPAHHFEIVIDTARNTPNVVRDETVAWEPDHGTRVEIELEGTYKGGRRSVDEYIEQVGLANPHAEIFYQPPKGRPLLHIPRATTELPREPLEIKPHPYGVELGMLQKILQDSESRTLTAALQGEFSRVTPKVAEEILKLAGLQPRAKPGELKPAEIERLHHVIPKVKIFAPPTACVVPIGEDLIRKGLEREIRAEFYTSATRPPAVYRGNPFQVEAGLAYGGELRDARRDDEESVHTTGRQADAAEGPITLLRLANRVPLQYQQSGCATFKAVVETNWRSYGLVQPRGSLPQGPMVLLVHIASVWVPFTSESKEAVAHYPEILKEMQLALQECGRRLGSFLRRREAERHEQRRRSIFEMYIGELVESLGKLTPVDRARLQQDLMAMARKHTGDEDAADVLAAVGPTRKVAKRTAEWTDAERESAGVGTEAEERSRGRKTGPGKPRGRGKKAGAATAAAAGTSPARRPRRSPQLELLDPDEEEAS